MKCLNMEYFPFICKKDNLYQKEIYTCTLKSKTIIFNKKIFRFIKYFCLFLFGRCIKNKQMCTVIYSKITQNFFPLSQIFKINLKYYNLYKIGQHKLFYFFIDYITYLQLNNTGCPKHILTH